MKLRTWEVRLGIYLLGTALILYFIDSITFHNFSYILDNLLLQLAYLPVYILLSTLIIDRLLAQREKKSRLRKLYMLIGVFFKESGFETLDLFLNRDDYRSRFQKTLALQSDWTEKEFELAEEGLRSYPGKLQMRREDFEPLKTLLTLKKDYLLRMMENPNLLEHEAFSELLWSVFHLMDELEHRNDLNQLPEADVIHLQRDADRAYQLLILEWLNYMKHLQKDYPYLYSLAVRTNPFHPEVCVEIQEE